MAASNLKIAKALAYLTTMGIDPGLEQETYEHICKAGFDKRTLAASFVLAQILVDHKPLSLRSAFYKAVSAGIYPDTSEAHYRQCGAIVLKLRRSGIVPYGWIADSLRTRSKPSSWSGLEDFGETVRHCYRKDFWASQRSYVEVVTEKDAMAGALHPVTNEYDVTLNVVRGNCSESHVWHWAEALNAIRKPIWIYYLGDFDPNGLDIERDLRERLSGFMTRSYVWRRIAVTDSDFKNDGLLGFPVRRAENSKAWTKRASAYIDQWGDRCVEVDAIDPNEIRQRVRNVIEANIEQREWAKLKQVEAEERKTIESMFWRKAAA